MYVDGERLAGQVLDLLIGISSLWCKLALLLSFLRVSWVSGSLFSCHS